MWSRIYAHNAVPLLRVNHSYAYNMPMRKVIAYYGSWAHYRKGLGKCSPSDIDPSLCTHLIYAFVGIEGDGSIKILDHERDITAGGFRKFQELKRINPNLKTLVAVGGWSDNNEWSINFSKVCANSQTRRTFVGNSVQFVIKHEFDGMDLDWEYPCQNGGKAYDKENFTELIKEMREAFDEEGLLLSAAVAATPTSSSTSYDIPALSKHLHFINLMAYDLHGSWEKKIGANAPLYEGPGDRTEFNVDACVQNWIGRGADPTKIILGIPFYGRTWTLEDPCCTDIGDPGKGPGSPGPYTQEPGSLGYVEITENINQNGWTKEWSKKQRVPYAYSGNQWVGYDNRKSIRGKVAYATSKNLGGIMIWSIENDDRTGHIGSGKWPLLEAINKAMNM